MTKILLPNLSRRGLLVGGASAFALAGCSGIIGPTAMPQLYVLKPQGGAATAGPSVKWQLSILTPDASEHLDSARIALLQSDTTLDYYANAEWQDRLPQLVQSGLLEGFENSGRIQAVSRDSAGFHADYLLQTELRDFEARYDTPDGIPTAVVHIEAKLVRNPGRDIIASLSTSKEVVATQNSVVGAVQALDTAFGAVRAQIVDWALSAPTPKD
jgi:cholesterol transport system auxiliary component